MKDPIERQDIINELESWLKVEGYSEGEVNVIKAVLYELRLMPSAQPDLNEWCTDCKEYDKEKHHCPRFNRVIREALRDAKPRKTGKWNFIGDNMFECTNCGVVYTTRQLNALRTYTTDSYFPKFCPNCGTMVG